MFVKASCHAFYVPDPTAGGKATTLYIRKSVPFLQGDIAYHGLVVFGGTGKALKFCGVEITASQPPAFLRVVRK